MADIAETLRIPESLSENEDARPGSAIMRPVEAVAAALVAFIIGVLLLGVISRYVFALPFVWVDEVASIAFIWLAMLGAAIAVDRNEHLRLTLFVGMMPPRLRQFAETLALTAVAAFLAAMVDPAIEYAVEESYVTSAALNIPVSWRVSALAVGIVLMGLLTLRYLFKTARLVDIAAAALLVGGLGLAFWWLGPTLKGLGYYNILIFLVGVVIRHYFNTRHARRGNPHWTWAIAVVLMLVIAWLSTSPKLPGADSETLVTASGEKFMATEHFASASLAVQTRCAMCHTAEPVWEGVYQAPKNVILDNDIAIANHAHEIAIQAGWSHAMPPGNVTEMTGAERALLVEWYRDGSGS